MSKGIILYTDGGAITNPGPSGSGIHGYIFSFATPKVGSGNSKVFLTQQGYLTLEEICNRIGIKVDKKTYLENKHNIEPNATYDDSLAYFSDTKPYEITPIEYIDSWYGYGAHVTNNYAELGGLKFALENIIQLMRKHPDLKFIRIFTDSLYTVKGYTEHIEKWEVDNWIKKDGKEITNKEMWIALLSLKHQLKEMHDVHLSLEWIKGHNGHLGNETADILATIGYQVTMSNGMNGEDQHLFRTLPAQGYWKDDHDKPVLMYNRHLIFNPADISQENENTFFTVHTALPLRFLGSNQSDCGFSLVRVVDDESNTLESIKKVIQRQATILDHSPIIVALDTDVLLSNNVMNDYDLAGVHGFMETLGNKKELLTTRRNGKRQNVTEVIYPPYVSFRIEDVKSTLEDIYNRFVDGDKFIRKTDITHCFYEKITKKSKGETVEVDALKKDIIVGFKNIEVDATYCTMDGTDYQASIKLVLGRDLADRNTLKRLEEHHPRIHVLTYPECDHIFRYVTLLETDLGWILSSNCYSNTRLIIPAS